MLERLVGCETEYAVRFSPRDGGERPSHRLIYDLLAREIGRVVHTSPGTRRTWRSQLFTENGGAFCYEALPYAPDDGLVEGGTPECRGPSQVLLYQKAQEALLMRALPVVETALEGRGYPGTLGLVKNGRDAAGHVYGAQENYQVEIARGLPLFLYRAGLCLLLFAIPFELIALWGFALIATVVTGLIYLGLAILAIFSRRIRGIFESQGLDAGRPRSRVMRLIGHVSTWIEVVLSGPFDVAFALLLRATAFRRIRKQIAAFLVSRPIISGTGTIGPDVFGLSEKGPAINTAMRTFVVPGNRPIFDIGNLMKDRKAPVLLQLAPYRRLFSRRQRLQLGLSDSNGAQIAEYLKFGTTVLAIDMIESGFLKDEPRLADPIAALHAIAGDPSLRAKVAIRGGAQMTALEIQRWYHARAKEFVETSPASSLEAAGVVRVWGEALDALGHDPVVLVGRLDWVTKRWLIQAALAEASPAATKKLDIRYHELGTGYLADMERRGAAVRLTTDEEIEDAMRTPPDSTPAKLRSRYIRELADSGAGLVVSWDTVHVGGRVKGKVIRLDDYR